MNPDVFISYDPSDATFVEQLRQKLKAGGLSTWVEGHDLPPAAARATAIAKAIQASQLFLPVISPEAVVSPVLTDQLTLAKEEGKVILPLLWRPTDLPPAWKLHLSGTQMIEFHGTASNESFARLKMVVTELVGLATLDQALAGLPPSGGPETLTAAEQAYRHRLTEWCAADAPYYIPLTGKTTEMVSTPAKESRAVRRRRQRSQADLCEWIQAGQELRLVKLDSLRQAVDKYSCVILLGEPGSGKTTALEHLAYELAGPSPQPSSATEERVWLPLPLRLSEFGPGLTVEEFIVQSWAGAATAGHWQAPELATNLTGYLESGRLLILFDGLNEMPHGEDVNKRTQALRRFITLWAAKGNRFLVTCRVLDYGKTLVGLQRVEIQPLDDEQIQAFLQKELPEKAADLWQALNEEKDGVDRKRSLVELARNPYLLTIMIDIYDDAGQLGRNRAELIARFSQMLFEWARHKCKPKSDWLAAEVQQAALSVMAFEMQRREGPGARVETGKMLAVMPQTVQPDSNWPPRPSPPDRVLNLAASAHIIEMPVDRSSVRFYHQLLQEYFAARELLTRFKADPQGFQNPAGLGGDLWRWPWLENEMPLWERPEDNYDPLPPPPPTGWEETTILAAGLVDAQRDDQLVRTLIEINPVLAGRCLHEGRASVDPITRQAVIEALLTTVARPEVALRVRIAAGQVLGYLGDPRLGEMVTIPAGEFWIGDDQSNQANEKPQHRLYLPEYQIGKYPVTNFEYEKFIEAGGYQDKRWWTEAGWQEKEKWSWTVPRFWQDGRYNRPNQPVVGVSWYECVAYCHWLTAETQQPFPLPTEAEWEKAARGTDGRQYPWGNEFDPRQLNSRESEQVVHTTTPVGIYPQGSSPFDLFDCAGNVFDWCTTEAVLLGPSLFYFKSYPYDYEEDEWQPSYLEGTSVRARRGGSWGIRDIQDNARCVFRSSGNPWGMGSMNFGFRLTSPI